MQVERWVEPRFGHGGLPNRKRAGSSPDAHLPSTFLYLFVSSVLIPSNHRGYKTSGARLKEDCLLFFASADEFSSAFAWKFEEELLSLPSDNS